MIWTRAEAGLVLVLVAAAGQRPRYEFSLPPLAAACFAGLLDEAAAEAEGQERRPLGCRRFGCKVTSYDRRVILKFEALDGERSKVIPMPPATARQIADLLRTNANFAGIGLRVEINGRS